ncbi:MAG TPA: isochorismatase family cysteine hydrolase [Myxococcota bacterium]|nr:isochorismatase family cysteine hydrolase [Myxococcota bacterium]
MTGATFDVACDHDRRFAFRAESTALLVIDMQRDFIAPGGIAAESGEDVSAAQAIVPNVARVLHAAREHGLLVVHTREGHEPDLSDLHPAKQERSTAAGGEIGAKGPLGRFLVRGEYGHDFVDELRPIEGELVIDKSGFGAFHATDLRERLLLRGVTHLFVTGVTTQCCVFSTLREAVDRGYRCLTISDCTAAFEPYLHEATMRMIASEGHLFGWISDTARVTAALI